MPQPRSSSRGTRRAALAERKDQNQTQQKLLIVIIAVVLVFGVAITAALMKGGDKPKNPNADVLASTATQPTTSTPTPAASSTTPDESDPIRARVTQLLRAIQDGDQESLTRFISFPRWHDGDVTAGRETKRWNELDSLTQTLARKRITEGLLADEATREFLKQSKIRAYNVMTQDDRRMKIQVILQSLIDSAREQERTIELEKIEGTWFLAAMTQSEIQTPAEMQAKGNAERAAERAKRGARDLAPIERQEYLDETPADVRSKIDGLCAKLTDLSLTKELSKAKRELAEMGKPAIPALLNLIVGREALETSQDQMIVQNAVSVLKDITQEDLGYFAGGIGGTMTGDLKKENVESLMRWFGWWRDHKKSWTGPRPPAEEN